jgi:TRAP-type mannitol/chloroaromatic compound transport system permease large subunit
VRLRRWWDGIITAVNDELFEKLTPNECNKRIHRRAVVCMLAIVVIMVIVLPTILLSVWRGFAIEAVGIIGILLWEQFEDRLDRNRTDWWDVSDL